MPALRAYDIARMRKEAKSLLTDLCDILTPTTPQSSGGDVLLNFIVMPGGYNVPYSLQHMTLRPTQLEELAERVIMPEVVKCYFAYDAPVSPGCRIRTHDNFEVWNIRGIIDELSPHKSNLPYPDIVTAPIDTSLYTRTFSGVYKVFVVTKI